MTDRLPTKAERMEAEQARVVRHYGADALVTPTEESDDGDDWAAAIEEEQEGFGNVPMG